MQPPFYPPSWHLKTHLRVAAPLDTGGNWNPGSADLCWLASKKTMLIFLVGTKHLRTTFEKILHSFTSACLQLSGQNLPDLVDPCGFHISSWCLLDKKQSLSPKQRCILKYYTYLWLLCIISNVSFLIPEDNPREFFFIPIITLPYIRLSCITIYGLVFLEGLLVI